MSIFDRIMGRQVASETTLGNPLRDPDAIERRMNYFAQCTNGNGFRIPAKEPRVDTLGLSRGDRKRIRAASARQREIERRQSLEASV